nr:FGGY-family carbohydrate kinase [Rhizobiaceae bacterium]
MGQNFTQPLVIGIDAGTTSIKAALFSASGDVLRQTSARHATVRPSSGRAEQDPDYWLRLTLEALTTLTHDLPSGALAAVGLTSQVNTHVFCDAALKPLLPAITWQDGRAAEEAAELDAKIALADKLRWWGAPLPIDASHVLARMLHVQRHHPDVWDKTRHVLAPKDWLIARLTGVVCTDPMTAFGVVDQSLALIGPLADLVGGARERLPLIAGFTTPAGRIRAGLPGAGAPMITGCMDAWAGLLGAGVSQPGEAVHLSGTSDILGIVSPIRMPTPGVIAFPTCEGITLHAGPTQCGGSALEWAARLFNRAPAEMLDMAAALPASARAPLFLPHLDGERAPLWDVGARGAFTGLHAADGAAEAAKGVLEGTGYAARWLLDTLERSAGCRPDTIAHAGGGAQSELWCQIRADILQRPLRRVKALDAGVAGAAMLAAIGAGIHADIRSAACDFVQTDRMFEPRLAEAARHEARFAEYRALYAALRDMR